jgi:LytR cell envelope-related transcriptional attenuator
VELPLQPPDALIRPWRTAAFVAASIALVELLILLAIGGMALAGAVSHSVERAAAQRARAAAAPARHLTHHTTAVPAARLPRSKTRVLVLNGNGRQGAAALEASRVRSHGYRIDGVANAPSSNYSRSIVMYRPRFAGEGRRLGHDLGISLVTALDGMRAGQLHGAQVVVILGR